MNKHILIVTNHFYPESFRINDMASAWIQRGYRVTVITQKPNYPSGEFYKGYKHKEKYNGIDIIRLPVIPRGHNPLMLILNYISYWFSTFIFSMFTRLRPDLVFAYQTSPIFILKAANRIGKHKRIPVYHYILDFWPDNLYSMLNFAFPFYHAFMNRYCRKAYHGSTLTFVSSFPFINQLAQLGAKKTDDVVYWPQYAEELYKPVSSGNTYHYLKNPHELNVIFTGNIGEAQGLGFLIGIALKLQEQGEEGIHFHLVGDGRERKNLQKNIDNDKVASYFTFYGKRPMDEMPFFLAEADLALVSFAENDIFETTVPAKLQSYLACGIPVITYARGEVNRIVAESEAGYAVAIGDNRHFIECLQEYRCFDQNSREMYSKAALSYYNSHFAKEMLLNKMDEYFDSI